MEEIFSRVNMVNSIIRIKWKVLVEFALLMVKYKKDFSSMVARMDLAELSILRGVITLVSSAMTRSMDKESKFKILVVCMKEHGKMINLFNNDRKPR